MEGKLLSVVGKVVDEEPEGAVVVSGGSDVPVDGASVVVEVVDDVVVRGLTRSSL